MIDGMLQDSIDATLDDRQQRPVAAPRPQSGFSIWNTIKAPVTGVAAGTVEAGGFAADVMGAFRYAGAFGAQADPTLLLSPEEMEKRRREADEARAKLDTGEAFSTATGTGLRSTARGMMPDPATSNVVENVLFGVGRIGAQAVGFSLLGGPAVGGALLAGSEGMTEAERLKAEGVDIETRTKVGAVAGGLTGAGVVLPVAGRTIAQTAALVVAGGPASYIAQQAASREILKNTGYDKIADQFDPYDPVGLAVSTLVPAGFGAWAARGMRGARPAPAADAAAARALVDMGAKERQALRYDDARLDAYAVTAAQREGIPPEALLAIKNAGERSGSSAATSPVGAKGLMQFMDATWAAYGRGGDVRDPIANIDGAARYMKDLIAQYGGDVRAAIAHYNGGGKAGEAVRAGKAPPAAETRAYLERTDTYMAQHAGETAGRAAAGDPDAVAAARTQLIRDTIDSWNLKDPTDITAAQDHLGAVVRASDQLGAGARVDVSDVINWDTLQSARMLDDMVTRLEAARSDLLPEAGQAAEPGAVRSMRQELANLRKLIPDTGDDAIRARAKEIQAADSGRTSYKEAQSAARREIAGLADEHAARIARLEQQIEANRGAEQARLALQRVDEQLAGVRSQRAALDAPPSSPKATAMAAAEFTRTHPALHELSPASRSTLQRLYEQAATRKPAFDATLEQISKAVGGRAITAKLKTVERSASKAAAEYRGDASKMKDLLRGTIEAPDLAAATAAIEQIRRAYRVVGEPRNLLDPAAMPRDGYRDAKFNVEVDGHVAEIQVNVPEMLAAKKEAHRLYRELTELERSIADRQPTEAELARIRELRDSMREIYDRAWERSLATSSANRSGETGAPLRRAESGGNTRGGSTSQAAEYRPADGSPSDTGTPSTSKNSASGERASARTAGELDISGTSGSSIADVLSSPAAKAVEAQAAEIARLSPDMMVQLEGMDAPMRLADALEAVKAQAEREAGDAPLLQIAAECFLRNL